MKRFKVLFGVLVMVFIFSGCAATSKHQENGMVKCPMCGHEFNQQSNP